MTEPYPPTPSTQAAQALEQLNSLPSLEETTIQVQSAIDQITAATATMIPDILWSRDTNASEGNCQAPYEQTDGRRYFLPNQVAQGVSLSEDQWSELLKVAKDAAAMLGATDVAVMKDTPGDHDVRFIGPTGVFIKFSNKESLVVAGYTGCRLPQDKKATPS